MKASKKPQSRSCKDPKDLESDLKKFEEAGRFEPRPITADDVRRIRQRHFGYLAEELAADGDD